MGKCLLEKIGIFFTIFDLSLGRDLKKKIILINTFLLVLRATNDFSKKNKEVSNCRFYLFDKTRIEEIELRIQNCYRIFKYLPIN